LKAPGFRFQSLQLEFDILVSSRRFSKSNLYRYSTRDLADACRTALIEVAEDGLYHEFWNGLGAPVRAGYRFSLHHVILQSRHQSRHSVCSMYPI
jgi:hypothetical protein